MLAKSWWDIAKKSFFLGMDDTDVLRILNASSISNGTLAHRACLRGVEKSDYATVSC